MTVNTTNITSGPYSGNDVADTFSYTFRIVDKSQVSVYETDDQGVQTLLTVDTDYTVAGIGIDAGGTITRVAGALPTGYEWFIRSNYKETQLTAFESQGAFFPDLHENAMDKLTFLIQQLRDTSNRSFRLDDSVDIDGLMTIAQDAASRAGLSLGFDDSGNLVVKQSFDASSVVQEDLDKRHDVTISTVAIMKSPTPMDVKGNPVVLNAGVIVNTQGYTASGDGGGARYLIKTAAEFGGTPDEIGASFTLDNGNIAVLQVNGNVSLAQFGSLTDPVSANACIVFAVVNSLTIAEEQDRYISAKDMLPKTYSGSLDNVITLIGDSISEGFISNEYMQHSFAAHLRRKLQGAFKTKNDGFANQTGSNYLHTATSSGVFPGVLDGSYYGGIYYELPNVADWYEYTHKGDEIRVVYEIVAGGGTFTVTIDGIVEATIDTSVGTPSKGAFTTVIQPTTSGWKNRTIRITKTVAGQVRWCGIEYRNSNLTNEVVFNNASIGGATASGLSDDIIDVYTDASLGRSQVILALGVNDKLTAASTEVFRAKIKRILDNVSTAGGSALVVDFMFNDPASNAYKVILREQALVHGYEYIDFAQEWYADETANVASQLLNVDGVHPTLLGHREIARRILTSIGIDGELTEIPQFDEYNPVTLQNSWVEFGVGTYGNVGYKINEAGLVTFRGLIGSGTTTPGTLLFTIPLSYAPSATRNFIVSSFGGTAFIDVAANGQVTLIAGGSATFTSLDGISFQAANPWVNN